MDDRLGIAGRLEYRAAPHKLLPDMHRVGEVAVMRDREAAIGEFGKQRLDVAERGLARGRITDMAHRRRAGQAADHLVAVEIACDMAHRAMAVEQMPVPAGDARGFLAAMLERVQAQRDHRRRRFGTVNAKDAALFAQLVVIERICGEHLSPFAAGRPYRGARLECRPL